MGRLSAPFASGFSSPLGKAVAELGATFSKITILEVGQSQKAYQASRGQQDTLTPHQYKVKRVGALLGSGTGRTPTRLNGTPLVSPFISHDGTADAATDWNVRIINAASGGLALLDVASPTETNQATSSQSPRSNYAINTQDNSAVSNRGAVDNGSSPVGPALDFWYTMIDTYKPDIINWGPWGTTDSTYVASGSTQRNLYYTWGLYIIDGLLARCAANGKSVKIVITQHGRHNLATDASQQVIAEIQQEWMAARPGMVIIGSQEYASEFAQGVSQTAMVTSGNAVISVADGTKFARNQRVTFAGITSYYYVLTDPVVNSFSISPTPTFNGPITVFPMDSVHKFPGNVETSNTTGAGAGTAANYYDKTKGMYWDADLESNALTDILKGTIKSNGWGPYVGAVNATAGEYTARLRVRHDLGATALITKSGSLGAGTAAQFGANNAGALLVANSVAIVGSGTDASGAYTDVDVTYNGRLAQGAFAQDIIPGAMNRSNDREFLLDNVTPPRPLQRQFASKSAALNITLGQINVPSSVDKYFGGAILQIDATMAKSWDGINTQTLYNTVGAPADGVLTSAYDFWLGNTSASEATDPNFTGTVGDKNAYFALDGGDSVVAKAASAFTNQMHQIGAGKSPWAVCVAYLQAANTPTAQRLFSTQSSSSTAGCNFNVDTDYQFGIHDGTSLIARNTGATVLSRLNFLIIQFDPVTSTIQFSQNLGAFTTITGAAFGSGIVSATAALRFCALNNGASYLATGSQFKGAMLFNRLFASADLTGSAGGASGSTSLDLYLKALHGRDYVNGVAYP